MVILRCSDRPEKDNYSYVLWQGTLENESKMEDPWQQLFTVVQLIGWNLGWDLVKGFQSTRSDLYEIYN